jgi:methyltransferase (TIGR00027 family)
MDAEIEDVADTALWIAAYRAAETESPRPLFRDPLAARLAGDKGRTLARKMTGAAQFAWMTVVRTVVIDDFLREAIAAGADTVVNLGAGLDTRPYRMELPSSLSWIEVDVPKIVALKEARLPHETPRCRLQRLTADLADDDARRRVLAQIAAESRRAVVLTEGVLAYLTTEDVVKLARDLHAHPQLQTWIVDHAAPFLNRAVRARRTGIEKNAPFKFETADPAAFYAAHGWRLAEMRYLVDVGERVGRPVPWPIWFRPLKAVLPRRAQEALRTMLGYARLERA